MSSDYTRRGTMQAMAALSLFGWGDDDDAPEGLDDLGFFDTHLVANDGEGITIDPELMDFAGAIVAEQTDDGVQISIDPDQLELDGLTNPLTDTLDAAGRNIQNVKSLDTEEGHIGRSALVGNGERPFISNSDTTVSVPGDYSTIQDALDDVPIYLRHNYWIEVDDGTYDEDIVVHPSLTGDNVDIKQLQLLGNFDTPSNVSINSLSISGCVGRNSPHVRGFEITQVEPYGEGQAYVKVESSTTPHLQDINVRPTDSPNDLTRAAEIYAGRVSLVNFDTGSNVDVGIWAKHGSVIRGNNLSGTPNDESYRGEGWFGVHGSTLPTGDSDISLNSGLHVDNDTNEITPAGDYKVSVGAEIYETDTISRSNGSTWSVEGVSRVNGVSTTDTTIIDFTDTIYPRAGMYLVFGANENDITETFTDLLLYAGGGGVTVVSSQERGSPSTRSYTESGNQLELAMSSETYDIRVQGSAMDE